ncbi:MAG: cytochrome c biogenesis protein CcdA [Erysipelotrichaceae bacterium]
MNETLYLSTVFIGGFLSFMSPCILPLLPVYFSMFAAEATEDDIKEGKSRRIRMILKTLTFVLGVSTIFVLLGFALPFIIISFFADILLSKMKKLNKHLHTIKVVGGIIIILMGVLLMSDSLYLITTLFER